MGYRGETYVIPMNKGGLTHNPNVDLTDPVHMLHPTRNLNLHENGRGKRGGTAHVYDAAISGTPRCMGIYDFTLENQTQFIISTWNDGAVYKDDTNTIKTGMSTANHFSFETFANELYIVDGATVMQTWDGSAASTSDVTNPAADWTGGNHPSQIIKHGKGQSERLWALGCPNNPRRLYGSADGDGQTWTTGVFTLDIDTHDGFGIVGAIEFGDRLLLFGKRQAYLLDDDDPSQANWGYQGAQWYGGVAHWRLLVRTPNDVIAMMEDGNIYSIRAAQEYGDYKIASLTRPSFMDRYIKEYVNLSHIDDFHGIYDPVMRTVKFFVVRNGQTTVDTALVYFIDRAPEEAWVVHGNWSNNSGYSASCSALVRVSAGNDKIYTGDYSGNLWQLEEINKNDDGAGYYAGFKTPKLNMDDIRREKAFPRGVLVTEPKGDYDLTCNWWVDDVPQSQVTISLTSGGAVLGSFVLGTDKLGGQELMDVVFALGNKGKRIQFEIYNSNANEDFFISQLLIDHKMLGKKPS